MAGTPGACSQVFCHPIRCISCMGMEKHTHATTSPGPPPPLGHSCRVFMLPGAQGQCGFIESDEAKAALALERDFTFSASYLGSFDMGDHVTFSERRGPPSWVLLTWPCCCGRARRPTAAVSCSGLVLLVSFLQRLLA